MTRNLVLAGALVAAAASLAACASRSPDRRGNVNVNNSSSTVYGVDCPPYERQVEVVREEPVETYVRTTEVVTEPVAQTDCVDFAHRGDLQRYLNQRLDLCSGCIEKLRSQGGDSNERAARFLEDIRESTRKRVSSLDESSQESWAVDSYGAEERVKRFERFVQNECPSFSTAAR